MATSRLIELEAGTFTKRCHPHDGDYGGDFWASRHARQATTSVNDKQGGHVDTLAGADG